jgi:hypothetical protein
MGMAGKMPASVTAAAGKTFSKMLVESYCEEGSSWKTAMEKEQQQPTTKGTGKDPKVWDKPRKFHIFVTMKKRPAAKEYDERAISKPSSFPPIQNWTLHNVGAKLATCPSAVI